MLSARRSTAREVLRTDSVVAAARMPGTVCLPCSGHSYASSRVRQRTTQCAIDWLATLWVLMH